ncbi:PBS lyase [Desulfuromonas versatilis]|uniref:PBS lyase n=1 Tax=Desulfuromonas versatilis TaxID=2802975 RepID=A0ABN6E1C6_9BACT|nr:HEAT repeat domain-containing protein [Desulfuromonas versatilis]BCR06130.1 PBS lyase [Desulfuromonas versatilis]
MKEDFTGADGESANQEWLKGVENALAGLVKLVKAIGYYPPGHPALKAAVQAAAGLFEPLLGAGENLALGVRREGFLLGERPLTPQNPMLAKLASLLFARRIQRLTILPDLTPEDLRAFARCISLESAEIQRLGGIQELLYNARVSTLWVNETDLAKILAQKEILEAQKKLHGEQQDEEPLSARGPTPAARKRDLQTVLAELRTATSDARYRQLLQELVPLLRMSLSEAPPSLVVGALVLLCRNSSTPAAGKSRREYSLHALNQLLGKELTDFLLDQLCGRSTPEKLRDAVFHILVYLREKVVPEIMERLTEEGEARARKILSAALVRQGRAAVPILIEHLADPRWFVVRNAVGILGEIRDQGSAAHFAPLLHHKEPRVRRETLRALTRIGGRNAIDILLHTVDEEEGDLRRQALLCLGAIKDGEAIPTLVKLVQKPDLMLASIEDKKAAIRALGEIGHRDAVPTLSSILRRRRFWRRSRWDELRLYAAQALGGIGDPEASAVLETAANGRPAEVARAASQALKQIRPLSEHES